MWTLFQLFHLPRRTVSFGHDDAWAHTYLVVLLVPNPPVLSLTTLFLWLLQCILSLPWGKKVKDTSSTRIKHGIFQLDRLCWSRSLFWLYKLRQYHKKREELLILTLKTSSPNNSLKYTHKSATKPSRTNRNFTFIIFTIFNLFTVETTFKY